MLLIVKLEQGDIVTSRIGENLRLEIVDTPLHIVFQQETAAELIKNFAELLAESSPNEGIITGGKQ